MEDILDPPLKKRRLFLAYRRNSSEASEEPDLLNKSEFGKKPDLHPPNESINTSTTCIDEAPAAVCPADSSNEELVVKQDEIINNNKESLMEVSQIEQESNTSKDKIVMEVSLLTTNKDETHPIVENTIELAAIKESSSEVQKEDNGHSHSRKKLLVLDVNGLLVDIVADADKSYTADTIIGSKSVFKRPYCDEFLKFCFERFNVGVWTSRTRRNIERVLDFLIKGTQHQLLFCWDQSHCTETGFHTLENTDKPLVLKELKKLWEKQDPNLPFDKGVYNESNTFLLDDSPYKALRNPPHTAIFPYTYSYRNTRDNGLGPEGNLRKYLERLSESDNVQKFIEQNPFGQQPISQKNESWKFYLKVIGDTSLLPKADDSKFRKKLLVIDVNGLLADVVPIPRESYRADRIHQYKPDLILPGSRAVFIRPHCDEFLQFCFDRFNVGLWSSSSRHNTDRVLDILMRDTQQRLLFSWDQSYCTDTGFRTVETDSKSIVLKQLEKLWEKKGPRPLLKGHYDESNTLLLDITPSTSLLNPPHTAIFPYPFRYYKTEDNSLGPEGDLRVYLERLAACENVQKFVEKNPFGQRPITNKNLSWGFYQKVIHAFSSKQEAKTVTNFTFPTKLKPESGTVSKGKSESKTNTKWAKWESESKTSTDSTRPTKWAKWESESESKTSTDSTLPTKSEPESGTALPNKGESESESKTSTDSTLPTNLEPESGTALPNKGESESKTITDSALPINLEPQADTSTASVPETVSESKADTNTADVAVTVLEPEVHTADVAVTVSEPEVQTADVALSAEILLSLSHPNIEAKNGSSRK